MRADNFFKTRIMANENEVKEFEFVIPANFSQQNRILGFRKRNLAEAAVAMLLVVGIVMLIPFVFKVKLIVAIVLTFVTGICFAIGVKNRSVTQWLIDYIHYKASGRKYHLRTVKDKKKARTDASDEYGQRLSYAEIVLNTLKKTIQEGDKDGIKKLFKEVKGKIIARFRKEDGEE